MKLEFDRSFLRDLDSIADSKLLKRLEKIILDLEKSESIKEIANLKKLTGFKTYYRIRIGDYRLGFELIDSNTIRLIVMAHRKDIYKNYP
jgi:mRNA interferase RelE/StbE